VKVAFADTEGRKHHLLEFPGAKHLSENGRPIGHELAAARTCVFAARPGLAGIAPIDDLVAEIEEVHRVRHIVLHHVKGVASQDLMHLGERPPGAANRAEGVAFMPLEKTRLEEA
jgi:hypothetical protein